ncbi:MAG: hypothetical protein IJD04_03875, partial [Desulfovibrionaceae bacterium]|nr:hypothetical protein [Desulfovibrionaceae bacterium]
SSFPDGTRKKYIISDLLKVNLKKEKQEIIEDRIKNILKDYSSMTGAIESGLKAIGIEVNKDGKHHKIYFKDCPEITHTLPSSGSDQRGWKNNFSELKKKLL